MDGFGSAQREPPSASKKVAKLRLYLRPMELSELEAEGVVVVDEDDHTVAKGPEFDHICDVMFE